MMNSRDAPVRAGPRSRGRHARSAAVARRHRPDRRPPTTPLRPRSRSPSRPRWAALRRGALATLPAALSSAFAQAPADPAAPLPGLQLRRSERIEAPPRGAAGRELPIVLRARSIAGRPDIDAVAEGDVEFRRGGTVLRSDRLTYDQAEDLAHATGNVVVSRDGAVFKGPELQLRIDRFEGFFREPAYTFLRTGASGRASRIDFLDSQRAVAHDATYSSCTAEEGGSPAWELSTDELAIDNDSNTGTARGAVLRFLGVPILAAPVFSFPLTDARKSGWLPPSFGIDSRSGVQAAIPWYWNIAPNRDATLTPSVSLRRGAGIDAEYRYLESRHEGYGGVQFLPDDRLAGRERHAFRFGHEGLTFWDTGISAHVQRVSDDDYWKDFPRMVGTVTPRLLQSDLSLWRPLGAGWTGYANVRRWQVLQTIDPTTRIELPYERMPQIGARWAHGAAGGIDLAFESEFNRFDDPWSSYKTTRQTGMRVHAIGTAARPFVSPGWTVTPAVAINAASYAVDLPLASGGRSATRVIPTFSLDSAWTLERETSFFGRAVRQTLEPRLLYVNTPYRRQDDLPNFDAAAKDFNFDSIFTPNAFSGVDRVSDAHQITAGVTSRVLDPSTGAEALRVGLVQRYLFRDQRVTPDGTALTRRFSDVLALGSTTLVPNWTFDGQVQWNPENARIERSLAGIRWSPGPFRTLSASYRLARGLSEQVELGWQWPIYGTPREARDRASLAASSGRACNGTLYTVGRVNYSTRDSRVTDAIVGFEYDAGCWIGRIVGERLSTGRSEATSRLLVQLELVGLSRLGSNPLRALKDNIPGYQLLRDERPAVAPYTPYSPQP
jgi:LPS-assembly protein